MLIAGTSPISHFRTVYRDWSVQCLSCAFHVPCSTAMWVNHEEHTYLYLYIYIYIFNSPQCLAACFHHVWSCLIHHKSFWSVSTAAKMQVLRHKESPDWTLYWWSAWCQVVFSPLWNPSDSGIVLLLLNRLNSLQWRITSSNYGKSMSSKVPCSSCSMAK